MISHADIHIIHVNVYPFSETDKYGKEHFNLEYDENLKLVNHVLPDILDFTPMYDMAKRAGRPFPWFTHEERAAYSKEYIPKEEAILRLKPSSADAIANYDFTRCVYGIPDESVLPEDDALEIAQNVFINETIWTIIIVDTQNRNGVIFRYYCFRQTFMEVLLYIF